MKKLFKHKQNKAPKTKLMIPTALLATTALLAYTWHKKDSIKTNVVSWKNKRIKNAFYDTLTQKDVAWG